MRERFLSKRVVLLVGLVAAAFLLVSGSRTWIEGRVQDPVLGATVLHGTGTDVAKGVLGAALVGAAAVVAAATGKRVVRWIAGLAVVLAAVLGGIVIVQLLGEPGRALGDLAASSTGRTGHLSAAGAPTVWPWLSLAACVLMGLAGLAVLVGGSRWSGLSATYDAPTGRGAAPARRRVESDWDRLSRGEDPTAGPDHNGP
ncbi:MAG TPA: Trp biosynthesis-associated membrane protein [Segeticoccus sp.]|uniref:Trp biosynthesis-associated membrane protein n=1 Tax=Segeticoccus sp. TaxID=2706531 RepID=UPI002D80A3B8|nr:Trp biosynthesis-associated membrane protein [Segeticoccus sp.]HET8599368.1 Trp biosynthesis-associated membrane protein [Segeticoccus sp.]